MKHSPTKISDRICLVCEKPFKGKTKLCPTCNKKRRKYDKEIPVGVMVTIKKKYPNTDPYELIDKNPNILRSVWKTTNAKTRATYRKQRSAFLYSSSYLDTKYSKNNSHIPDYINEIFKKDKSKTILYLDGEIKNPKIYYFCKRCGKEQCQTYFSLSHGKGHQCTGSLSSGEAIVREYLRLNRIPFVMQMQTLKCINPRTLHVLPYDFELKNCKVIIEVQGVQHFEFSPFFHGDMENYNYQLWKDKFKKEYAESNGYRVLYLDYKDIESEKYKDMISDLISNIAK